jgi:hypothetical protein
MLQASSPGMEDIGQTVLRPYAEQKLGKGAGKLSRFNWAKAGSSSAASIFPAGLVGTNSWGIIGYEPGYAMKLVKNLIIWSENHRR